MNNLIDLQIGILLGMIIVVIHQHVVLNRDFRRVEKHIEVMVDEFRDEVMKETENAFIISRMYSSVFPPPIPTEPKSTSNPIKQHSQGEK